MQLDYPKILQTECLLSRVASLLIIVSGCKDFYLGHQFSIMRFPEVLLIGCATCFGFEHFRLTLKNMNDPTNATLSVSQQYRYFYQNPNTFPESQKGSFQSFVQFSD